MAGLPAGGIELACRLLSNWTERPESIFSREPRSLRPTRRDHPDEDGIFSPSGDLFAHQFKAYISVAGSPRGDGTVLLLKCGAAYLEEHQSGLHNHQQKLWNLLVLGARQPRHYRPSSSFSLAGVMGKKMPAATGPRPGERVSGFGKGLVCGCRHVGFRKAAAVAHADHSFADMDLPRSLPDELAGQSWLPPHFVTLTEFSRQMEYITRRLTPVHLDDAIRQHRLNRCFAPRSVAVTFDYGYENNLTLASPVLERYGIPATIFLSTRWVEEGALFPFDRLRLLRLWKPELQPSTHGTRRQLSRRC